MKAGPSKRLMALLHALAPDLPALAIAGLLASFALNVVVQRCQGIAVPLDDAYIHFTYARAFARLEPFVYSPGAAPSAGATSLLWPLVLSPVEALTHSATAITWVAVCLGFFSLWGLSRETRLLATRLMHPTLARFTALLPLAFAANTWFAASGMEVLPFSLLLLHTCRKILDWLNEPGPSPLRAHGLIVLAALCVLTRPEGALMAVAVAVALSFKDGGFKDRSIAKVHALFTLSLILLPSVILFFFTGQWTPTTAQAKWLVLNPYFTRQTLPFMLENLRLFLSTLLNGQGWTPMFLPAGCAPIFWLAGLALTFRGLQKKYRYAVLLLLWLSCGVVLASSYQTFLVNRLRYIWPFITPWFLGLGIVADQFRATLSQRLPQRLSYLATGIGSALLIVCAGGLAGKVPQATQDLATSARAINDQQVWLAHWAKRELPSQAMLGINDAGALGYFSGHRTFDLVGLTTQGEARHWLAGAGSRFEPYEHLGRYSYGQGDLPDYFVVYPEWLGDDLLLGEQLIDRHVEASILGGQTMGVYRADYSALNSASQPSDLPLGQRIVDQLDVADLESEQAHGYALLTTGPDNNRIYRSGARADGGRSERTEERFTLNFGPNCSLVLRLHNDLPKKLELRIDASAPLPLQLPSDEGWSESRLVLPPAQCQGKHQLALSAPANGRFDALHYWSISSPNLRSE
ncbi:MAG TPA: hypothetical protein VL137_09455 [Polyangiaceae bacterium]|nr:hypothetical protein [Polyangiaceae bacterium]